MVQLLSSTTSSIHWMRISAHWTILFMDLPARLGILSPMLAGTLHFRGNYEESE